MMLGPLRLSDCSLVDEQSLLARVRRVFWLLRGLEEEEAMSLGGGGCED